MVARVKISSRNQIAVPAEVRKDLSIKPGDHLLVYVRNGHIVMVPEPEDVVEHLRGLHREVWEGVEAQEYVNQERDAWED